MLDHDNLSKYFTEAQRKDIIELNELCMRAPPGRIRRPRFRKPKPNHVPRPVNSFMSYRTEKQLLIRKFCPAANHREISKIVANWWHATTPDEKAVYIAKATAAKNAHAEKYPDYVFRPKSKKLKNVSVPTSKKSSFIDVKPTLTSQNGKKQRTYSPNKQETSISHSSLYQDDVLFEFSSSNSNNWNINKQDSTLSSARASETFYSSMSIATTSNTFNPNLNLNLTTNFTDLGNEFLDPILTTATANLDHNLFLMHDPILLPSSDHFVNTTTFINSNDTNHRKSTAPPIITDEIAMTQIYLTMMTPCSQALETPLLDYFQSPASHTQQSDFTQTLIPPTHTLTNRTIKPEQLDAPLIGDMLLAPNASCLKMQDECGHANTDYANFNKFFTDYSFSANGESLFSTSVLSSPTDFHVSSTENMIHALNQDTNQLFNFANIKPEPKSIAGIFLYFSKSGKYPVTVETHNEHLYN
ncbi:uncharacterized protein BX663DRAFT_550052 [Cokeromyces recurvatus]|uniref:uncharacterized protein n=1 Tax=Cokeromyces recurvatus TaxID=90255 RepID=UPI00221EE5DD|nr:uncharacterized protein BX663DRAFT_550052 [Cokeromyces recurvatus]KAI7905224.1 hypothetical protein BX663DRAFT_550052 [Cokeromyces recurvatus]